ncbi:MAG: thermonuclease family protein [Ignavibacteria bacterium]|nr:thermonuclease family protein [Ignavibacteria bacterium]
MIFKLTKGIIKTVFTLGLFLIILAYFAYNKFTDENSKGQERKTDLLSVKRVVDGDTFEMSDGQKVRLLGIDTPEKYESNKLDRDTELGRQDKATVKKLGRLASDYAKAIVEGKNVRLERDPINEDKDRYGRLLRYVYLEDGTCVNAKIISEGYAQVYDKFPISKLEEFRKLQREARENRRGLWGDTEGLKQFDK